jgi:hypothetical protein
MNDLAGISKALVFSGTAGGQASSPYFQSSLEGAVPAFELFRTTTWMNNPDARGGTLHYAEATASGYGNPRQVPVVAMSSESRCSGTRAYPTIYAPLKPRNEQYGTLASAPIRLPGIGGSPISIDLNGPMLALPLPQIPQSAGTTTVGLRLPNLPSMLSVAAVPAIVDLTRGTIAVGNTARLNVAPCDKQCKYVVTAIAYHEGCAAAGCPWGLGSVECGKKCAGPADCPAKMVLGAGCAGGGWCAAIAPLVGCMKCP